MDSAELKRQRLLEALVREALEYPGPSTPPGWGKRAKAVLNDERRPEGRRCVGKCSSLGATQSR